MPETDNQPESVAVRYAAFVSAVLLIGGGLLVALGTGVVGTLVLRAGAAVAVITGVLFLVLKFLAVPSANTLMGFLGAQSGSSTPTLKGYSAIEALAAQGRYQEAAKAYEREIAADPSDVEARSRLAQLLVDHLEDPIGAARALAEARDRTGDERHRVGYALRLVDLYRSRLRDRGKAMVELRRLIDTSPQSPHLDGVRRELADLIEEMRSEQNGDPR
jgi:tetratricopeptide (TPR) repeat protein